MVQLDGKPLRTIQPGRERPRTNLRSRVSPMMQAVKGLPMEKWLCWGSMGVAGLMLLLFVLDLIFTIPFGGISKAVDILSIICSAVVLYLGWDASRDLR